MKTCTAALLATTAFSTPSFAKVEAVAGRASGADGVRDAARITKVDIEDDRNAELGRAVR